MTISGLPYNSEQPSITPPTSEFYQNKEALYQSNSVENRPSYLNDRDSNKDNNVSVPSLNLNSSKLVHGRNNFNVVSRTQDSSNNLNVVVSNTVSEFHRGDKFDDLNKGSKDNQYSDKCVSNFQLIRSKFEPKGTKLSANKSNINNRSSNYLNGNKKINEPFKVCRDNLNVVKEYKKDVPTSLLPIMYQDDVEALLSRKPNSVRNFVNSLNKQLKFSNKNTEYKLKFGNYETKYPNVTNTNYKTMNNDERDKTFDLKLEDLNNKMESLDRNGLFGHFDEFRDFVNFEKYISKNHKLHLNGNKKHFGDNSVKNNDVDRDNMLTYRSNTFGNFSGFSTMSDFSKSTSDLCNNSTRDCFQFNRSGSNFYQNGNYCINSFSTNFGGNLTTNFDNYFNNMRIVSNDSFKGSKLSSRSNLTRISTQEFANCVSPNMYKDDLYYSNKENEFQKSESEYPKNDKHFTFSDILFSKRFIQSFKTLPEGVNLVLDTPKSEISPMRGNFVGNGYRNKGDDDIFINSVNLIKSGWVWVRSSKTKDWLPKFMVLFYDEESSPKNQYTHLLPYYGGIVNRSKAVEPNFGLNTNPNLRPFHGVEVRDDSSKTDKDYNRYFIGDTQKSNDGFWSIYQVYTQLNPNLNTLTNSRHSSPNNGVNVLNSSNLGFVDPLIRDNSVVYLCILNHEPSDYFECITTRKYLQLYKVDTSVPPYLRSFNSCWLSRLITNKIKSNLELIVIPLADDYECCFAPLCASKLNPDVTFSYEMELSYRNKVNDEYNQWMFKLWEYSLRSNSLNLGFMDKSTSNPSLNSCSLYQSLSVNSDKDTDQLSTNSQSDGFFSKCYKYICNLFGTSEVEDLNNSNLGIRDKSKLRTHIIESIKSSNKSNDLNSNMSLSTSFCSDTNPESNLLTKDENVENENLPSPQNFINWIDKYGFDDLSIKINMYTLINRL